MTTLRIAVLLLLLALVGACGSPGVGGAPAPEDRAAVWQFDHDANLAYPTCWNCSADVDRGVSSCDQCGSRTHIESKTIACPECDGSKGCIHCGPKRACVACEGTHACPICDGTGASHGAACPDCEGKKGCGACCEGAPAATCERCDDAHACANCDATGTIVLE